jgi:hypothetical protein
MTRDRKAATLVVRPLERLPGQARTAVDEEGARLLAFLAADADTREVRVGPTS